MVPSNTRLAAPFRHVTSGKRAGAWGLGVEVFAGAGFDLTFGAVTGIFKGSDSPEAFLLIT